MSHELHSSKYYSIWALLLLSVHSAKISEQQDVEVVFAHDEVPYSLSQDISLCLLRVLQEALQNAVKHSGGGHFDAELRFTSGAMYLSVRDWGPGFDVERAMKTYGPGLISMTERLELVGEHSPRRPELVTL